MANIQVLNGNRAAAIAAAMCRPDIIAAYPITPQTPIVEYLAEFVANGFLDSSVSEVESELSAMSVVTGASLAGSRTFTASASQGLSLMYEPYFRASTLRLPIVKAIVNREMISGAALRTRYRYATQDGCRSMSRTTRKFWTRSSSPIALRKIKTYCCRSTYALTDFTFRTCPNGWRYRNRAMWMSFCRNITRIIFCLIRSTPWRLILLPMDIF